MSACKDAARASAATETAVGVRCHRGLYFFFAVGGQHREDVVGAAVMSRHRGADVCFVVSGEASHHL